MTQNGNARRRNILFITTDQMRYDSLQCNGGKIARTPVADKLSAEGINYRRANNQNVVCMPARSTMITGQYVRTHGVFANGVPLPEDAPSIAGYLHENGYKTALIGKAHFQPALDLGGKWFENRMARENSTGPYRGFDYMELAMHGPQPMWHYGKWLQENHPAYVSGFYQLFTSKGLNDEPGGDTGAPEVKFNPLPREYYHTDWVGERTIRWLDTRRRRRPVVPLDVLPRPAPPVGPAGGRDPPRQLARPRPAGRPPRQRREVRGDPRAEAGALAGLLPGPLPQRRGRADALRAEEHDARPGARSERDDAHPERADRRGLRPRHQARRGARLAGQHRHLLHHRPRRAAGRLRADVQGPVPLRRADAHPDDLAPGAVGRRHARRGDATPSARWTSRRRSARSPACPSRSGCRATPCRERTASPAASA